PNVGATVANNLVVQEGGNCVEIRWSPELGGIRALASAPRMDHNGYPRGVRPCRFLDLRPESPLPLPVTSFERWRDAMGVDAHGVQAHFLVDGTGRPLAGSAALGAGTPLPEVPADVSGAERSSTAPTIGAYGAPAEGGAIGAIDRRRPPHQPTPGEGLREMAGDTAVVALSGLARLQHAWPRAANWITPMKLMLLGAGLLALAAFAFALV